MSDKPSQQSIHNGKSDKGTDSQASSQQAKQQESSKDTQTSQQAKQQESSKDTQTSQQAKQQESSKDTQTSQQAKQQESSKDTQTSQQAKQQESAKSTASSPGSSEKLEYKKPTDETHTITLTSTMTLAIWNKQIVMVGANAPYEIRTNFVGNGSDIKLTIKDKPGKTIEKVKGKVYGNLFAGAIVVPEKAREELSYQAEMPKHSLKMKSTTVKVIPLIKVTNLKWGQKEARREDIVKLSAEVEGAQDETELKLLIYEYDADGAHDLITKFPVKVKKNKIEAEWEYQYHEDTLDIPTDGEMKDYGKNYNHPEYFFIIDVYGKAFGKKQESELLKFIDWVELDLADADGKPIADEDYVLKFADGSEKKGKLDKDGMAQIKDVPPGKVGISYPNISSDSVTASEQG